MSVTSNDTSIPDSSAPGTAAPDTTARDASTYFKFRNEVMAGGTDGPEADEVAGGPRAVIGLSIIAGLLVLLGLWSTWALLFVVGLLICIFLHEVGHFVTARWTGMKATQFFLFMGPKLWSFRRGETEYGVRAYPLGAFVRIIGMNNIDEVDPADEPRAYRSKSYPRRMLVITAGSLMHMIIAIVLLFGVYATKGRIDETGRVGIGAVVEDSPAGDAGLQRLDIIESINGVVPASAEEFVAEIQRQQPGDTVSLVINREGELLTTEVTLGSNPNEGEAFGRAYLGVASGMETDFVAQSPGEAFTGTFNDLATISWQSAKGLVQVVNPVNLWGHLTGTNEDLETRPSTVVGISRASSGIGDDSGWAGILITLAYVNVFVGLFNMIPLLPFDGGHAAIATYERLRSRRGREPYRADVTKMVPVAMGVMTLIAFIFFTGLYLDITKPL